MRPFRPRESLPSGESSAWWWQSVCVGVGVGGVGVGGGGVGGGGGMDECWF